MRPQSLISKSGLPRFRTTPEFEEKLCTKCGDYWPCDTEFFRRSYGHWFQWCRACEAEAVRVSRRRSVERRAATLIAATGLTLASTGTWASDYCDSIAAMATSMQRDKEAGYTRQEMAAVLTASQDDEAREVGAAVIRLVYVGNSDNGLTAGAIGRLARAARLTTEPNAMNARKP